MRLYKQDKFKLLGAIIILMLLLLPGITLAEQALKAVYKQMTVTETKEPIVEQQDLGEPIIPDSAASIEQQLNNSNLIFLKDEIQDQDLYGNRLVYITADTQELKSFNLKTKETISVSKTPNFKDQLAIFKDRVIWTENNQTGLYEIWAYDFKDDSLIKVSDRSGDLSDIYGDMVVYRGVDQPGIYLYNFKTEKTITITEMPNGIYSVPTIWKDIVTWTDESEGNPNAYYYDIKTSTIKKITNNPEGRYIGNPVAANNSIIYPHIDETEDKLLMEYDIKKGVTQKLPDLNEGIFKTTVDKFSGNSISYRHMNHETVIIDLATKKLKVYPTIENKVVYGGVIIGTEKDTPKFKVQRNQ